MKAQTPVGNETTQINQDPPPPPPPPLWKRPIGLNPSCLTHTPASQRPTIQLFTQAVWWLRPHSAASQLNHDPARPPHPRPEPHSCTAGLNTATQAAKDHDKKQPGRRLTTTVSFTQKRQTYMCAAGYEGEFNVNKIQVLF